VNRRRFLAALGALPLSALSMSRMAHGAPAPALKLGVMPYHAASFLLRYHEPLRAHLERALGMPVRLETSRDVAHFQRDMIAVRFDLVLTAPHYARVAQLDLGWLPLAQIAQDNELLLVTRKDSPLRQVADLRGKRLAVPEISMLQSLASKRWLTERGLDPGRDIEVFEAGGHGAALNVLLAGRTDAAVATLAGLGAFGQADLDRMHVLANLGAIPHLVLTARPGLDRALTERIGRATLAGNGAAATDGFTAASEARMKRVDTYLDETRRYMGLPAKGRAP
jgi:phosphonate transport system substrate-binding protein